MSAAAQEGRVVAGIRLDVQRVLGDEFRADLKRSEAQVSVSMQIGGHAFSAKGPRWYVEDLLAHWEARATGKSKSVTEGFNRMKLISGPSR